MSNTIIDIFYECIDPYAGKDLVIAFCQKMYNNYEPENYDKISQIVSSDLTRIAWLYDKDQHYEFMELRMANLRPDDENFDVFVLSTHVIKEFVSHVSEHDYICYRGVWYHV